ncbi:MAG: dihydrofolate reductase [Bacteroidales bacterium]|nr:dihydrofolate reductase [Bacteroidales bacterium]
MTPEQTANPNPAQEPDFKYLVDEFADLKVMRYRIPGWDSLTLRQKEYLYCLGEAAKYGRDIIFDQNFKYNLLVRKTLEAILKTYSGDRQCADFQDFVVYAKRVFFSNGIHHHYGEVKFLPGCSADYFLQLLQGSDISQVAGNKSVAEFFDFLRPIIFDPELYKTRRSSVPDGDNVTASSVNFYEGLNQAEAEAYYAKCYDASDERPLSYGLNSKLVKYDDGIHENIYRIGGMYDKALKNIIFWLRKANVAAENSTQRHYTDLLIKYYSTGDLHVWDEYNIAWVEDNTSFIDFVNGFIETYTDPLGIKATWEAVVDYKDREATRRTNLISSNAQWFEDHSPVDPRFKKKECKGISAKAIIVTTLAGDCYPTPPIGINLPNADWIRKEHGSKSVTITNLIDAYNKAAKESPKSVLKEFAYTQDEVDLCKTYGDLTDVLHTDLHECLGHGSGQLLPTTNPNALKEYASTLEEARADLFGLYYLADQKLIDLGILPDDQAFKAEYSGFIRNGLMTQLTRIELGDKVTESHMQDRKLIAQWCFEQGRADNVIERKSRDGKTYFVINDYQKLRTLFGRLLAEIQRIKSEGDYAAGKAMVETYGVDIDHELHQEVLERYKALNLKPYGGFLNPEIIPVEQNGKVVDYRVEYPTDFLQQHLLYGEKYATLGIEN